jgi:hypothetical protein
MYRQKLAAAGTLLAVFAALVCTHPAAAQSTAHGTGIAGGGPAVFFPEKGFEFQAVIDGANVVHDFVVLNKGSVPLLISNVRTP